MPASGAGRSSRRRSAALASLLGLVAGLTASAWLLRSGRSDREGPIALARPLLGSPERAPLPPQRVGWQAPSLAPAPRSEALGAGPRNVEASERATLARALEEVLAREVEARDRDRLADLLLEARELRGREAPAREREILVVLSNEFERLAGAPMGDVVSRLPAGPGAPVPRPARLPAPRESGSP